MTHVPSLLKVSSLTRVTSVKSANSDSVTHSLTSLIERQVTLKSTNVDGGNITTHSKVGGWIELDPSKKADPSILADCPAMPFVFVY